MSEKCFGNFKRNNLLFIIIFLAYKFLFKLPHYMNLIHSFIHWLSFVIIMKIYKENKMYKNQKIKK